MTAFSRLSNERKFLVQLLRVPTVSLRGTRCVGGAILKQARNRTSGIDWTSHQTLPLARGDGSGNAVSSLGRACEPAGSRSAPSACRASPRLRTTMNKNRVGLRAKRRLVEITVSFGHYKPVIIKEGFEFLWKELSVRERGHP